MRNRLTRLLTVVTITLMAICPSTASAITLGAGDTIKLDFSSTGDGDGGSLADWNQTNNGSASISAGSVIRHGDGAVLDDVSINFSGTGVGGGFNNDAGSNAWPGQGADPYLIGGANDIFFGGGSMTATFDGLDPLLKYNVRAYTLIGNNGTAIDRVIVDGATSQTFDSTRGSRFGAATLEAAGTVFSGIKTNATGGIAVTAQGVSGAAHPLQAFVLEAVFDGSTLFSVDIAGGPTRGCCGDVTPQAMSGVEASYGFGDTWNEYFVKAFDNVSPAPAPLESLVDSDGNASSVQFQILGDVQGWTGDPGQGTDPLLRDYLFLDAGQSALEVDWEINGLVVGGLYELYAYGGTVPSRALNLFVDQTGEAATFGAAGHLFGNIRADSLGRITGSAGDGAPGGEQDWSGFQLRLIGMPVPEPTTALLLATGAMGLVRRRRRIA